MLFFIRESASASQVESIIGTWCMAAQDIDRQVSEAASKSWNSTVTTTVDAQSKHQLGLEGELLGSLMGFIQKAALDPLGVYAYLNPAPPVAPHPPAHRKSGTRPAPAPARQEADQSPRAKSDEVEESDQDKKARIRYGAIGAIRCVIGNVPAISLKIPTNAHVESSSDSYTSMSFILLNPALWSTLCSADNCPFAELESFGYAQPIVRKSAWALLQSTLRLPRGKDEGLGNVHIF